MSNNEKTTPAQRWVLGLASMGSVMVALDALVVAAALTTIRTDLGASIEQLEWTVNAYTLSFAMLMMAAAAVGDRWGRRRMFATGLTLFALASIGCALAPTIGWLVAARAVQGVGAAIVMPVGMGLLGAAFPPERRGWATGIFSGVTGLAVLCGPLVGGAVTEGLAWEWIFWINVPVAAVAAPLVLAKIPESRGPQRRVDVLGSTLITMAVLGLVWGLVRGEPAGWGSPEVVSAFVLGVVLLAAFLGWEARAPQPMVPLSFFRSRTFTAGNAAGFFLTSGLFGAVFFVAQFMQLELGSGPAEAGLQMLPWTATLFVIGPIAGRLVDRVGERPLVVTGLGLQGVGMFWISAVSSGSVRYADLVLPMMLAGFGVSMAMPAAQSASIGALPREAVGMASGIYAMMRQLGGAVGVAVLAAVFAAAGGYAAFDTGFTRALVVCGVLSMLGAASGLGIAARRAPRTVGIVVRQPAEEMG